MRKINLTRWVWDQYLSLPKALQKGPIYLAVSGGTDSSVLASVALSLKEKLPPLNFIHINYHLRVPESDQEEKHLTQWAQEEGIPLWVKRFYPKRKPKNLQEWARVRRYRFFSELIARQSKGRGVLWVAHHQRDQAETVLDRLLQGSGFKGLGGMASLETLDSLSGRPLKGPLQIFRPLLEVPFESIQNYAEKNRVTSFQDQSNLKDDYRRNRIRRGLLPAMAQENPQIQVVLTNLAKQCRETHREQARQGDGWLRRNWEQRKRALPTQSLKKVSPGVREYILAKFIQSVVPEDRSPRELLQRVARYLEAPQGKQEILLKNTWRLELSEAWVRIRKRRPGSARSLAKTPKVQEVPNFEYSLKGPGCYYLKELNQTLEITACKRITQIDLKQGGKGLAFLDEGQAKFPLRLAMARSGERFLPLGMQGSKGIRRFLMEQGVPKEKRQGLVLYNSSGVPLWLVGHRSDERAKVGPESLGAIRVSLHRGEVRKP